MLSLDLQGMSSESEKFVNTTDWEQLDQPWNAFAPHPLVRSTSAMDSHFRNNFTNNSAYGISKTPPSPRERAPGLSSSPSSRLSDGELAKKDHEAIIYGALLEECEDRLCTGIPSGCLKAHTWNAWQTVRRDPRKFNYGSKLCSFYSEGSCQKGDQCSFAHSKTEVQFHPKVYKTQACNRFPGSRVCGNKLCAFYHVFDDGSDDSRKLPDSQSESGSPSGSVTEENVWLDRPSFRTPGIRSPFLDSSSMSVPGSPKVGFGSKFASLFPSSSQLAGSVGMSGFGSGLNTEATAWKPTFKRSLERSTSEMKLSERPRFLSLDSLDSSSVDRSMTPPIQGSRSSVEISPYDIALYHWSLEHLDLKMKNPNRKESQFGLNLLAWVPDFPLRELIKSLYDESWTVEQLRSYLSHTLVRALEEKKVVLADSGKFAGFNTGLNPPNASYSMIAILTYSPVQQGTKFEWTLTHFKAPAEVLASKFLPFIPSPVCYMDGKADMWFDVNKHILFGEQLLSRVIDRITEVRPDFINYDVFIQKAILEKAIHNAEKNVGLNPNVAVPSFYRPKGQLHGSVQFLLPISFTDDSTKVDGALAVQERSQGYVACTVLSLQDAYAHARLIGKPSATWLGSVFSADAENNHSRAATDEKLSLDKFNGVQFFYHENSVPRLLALPCDDVGDKDVTMDIKEFLRKFDLREFSLRKIELTGKPVWEVYLNHSDFMAILKTFGRMSSLEVYLENFVVVNLD